MTDFICTSDLFWDNIIIYDRGRHVKKCLHQIYIGDPSIAVMYNQNPCTPV